MKSRNSKRKRAKTVHIGEIHGFSIVEVMIGAMMSCIVLLGFSSGMVYLNRIMKQNTIYVDWKSLIGLMRTSYSNPAVCKNMFNGTVYNGSSISLSKLGLKSAPGGTYGSVFLDLSNPAPVKGIKPISIAMKQVPGVTTKTTTTTFGDRKIDQVYLYIEARREVSGVVAPPMTTIGDLSSGRDPGEPDTIQLVIYSDVATYAIQECGSTFIGLGTNIPENTAGASPNGACTVDGQMVQDPIGIYICDSNIWKMLKW